MAISQIESQNLGKFLQIMFSDGVRNQLSEDFRDWETVAKMKSGDPAGREQRFYLQTGYGANAIQWAPIASPGDFPSAQQVTAAEYIAKYKEINATIELEYNLWERARMSGDVRYAEPLAIEIESKATASKRRLSVDLYGDGTGVMGQAASASIVNTDEIKLVLSSADSARGHVGFFEFQDRFVFRSPDNATDELDALNGGSSGIAYLQVEDKNRAENSVTFTAYNSSGVKVPVTSVASVSANDVLYRLGQPTRVDLTSIGSADYNGLTEVMVGLESLAASDSRVVHGMTMRGALAGSRYDASAQPLDVIHFQRALSQAKTAVGGTKYKYSQANLAPESLDALIESRETDRRFISVEDSKRGTRDFAYMHDGDTVKMIPSEFVPKKRIWILPESKATNEKVLELWGSDFRQVKVGSSDGLYLKPSSSGGHSRFVRSYLEGVFCLIAKHPKAIIQIHNFTVS